MGGRSGARSTAAGPAPRKAITSGHVAFVLAPRINAAGRLGNAEQGLRLLLARDPGEAEAIARSLEDDNNRRRQMDEQVLIEAEGMVKGLGYPDCSSIPLWSDKWHPAVIGIVARGSSSASSAPRCSSRSRTAAAGDPAAVCRAST